MKESIENKRTKHINADTCANYFGAAFGVRNLKKNGEYIVNHDQYKC